MELVRKEIEEELLDKKRNLNARKIPYLENDHNELFLDILRVTNFLPEDVLIQERLCCIRNNIKKLLNCPYCGNKRSYVKNRNYISTCGNISCGLKLRYSLEKNKTNTGDSNLKIKGENRKWFYEELNNLDKYKGKSIDEPYLNFSSRELIINCLGLIAETNKIDFKIENKDLKFRYKLIKGENGICDTCGIEHLNYDFKKNIFFNHCSKSCMGILFKERRIKETRELLEKEIPGFTIIEIKDFITKAPVKLQCSNNHIFDIWLQGGRRDVIICPICNPKGSSYEGEIADFIFSLGIKNIVKNSRQIINPLELDIYCPDFKIAIEYNGNYWHSYSKRETDKEKNYHLDKFLKCKDEGIDLIQITENDWLKERNWIESLLKSKFGIEDVLVYWNYSDLNRAIGNNMYGNCSLEKLGFKINSINEPDFTFINNGRILTRNQCQKHRLKSVLGEKYNKELTMEQNMFDAGFRRLWDAGTTEWIR